MNESLLVKVFAVWSIFVSLFVTVLAWNDKVTRAGMLMAWGLILLWVVVCGSIMYRRKDLLKQIIQGINFDWRLKFVVFAAILALIEEVITVGMTNMALVFGVKLGEVFITASADYFDVVLFHSVIVFIPMFATWAFLLSRYNFSPSTVFLLFGFTGIFIEAGFSFYTSILNPGLWLFVYGLMVYLPAYCCVPENLSLKNPGKLVKIIAVFLPFIIALPVAFIVSIIHPVRVHF